MKFNKKISELWQSSRLLYEILTNIK